MARSTLLVLSLVPSLVSTASSVAAQPTDDKKKPATDSLEVSLIEAVAAAMEYHPDVVGARVDHEVARITVDRVDATFSPVVTLNGSGRQQELYNEFAADADSVLTSTSTIRGDLTIAGKTRFGTSYELLFSSSRQSTAADNPLSTLSPRFTSEVSGRVSQPLLRGAWGTANRGRVERERLNADVVGADGRERVRRIVLDVVVNYWGLALRRKEVEILIANLDAAKTLRDVVARRVKAGKDARSSLIQADSTVAERRRAVEAARLNVVDAERALLGVSYLTRAQEISARTAIISSDEPGRGDRVASFEKELATAISNRPEVTRAANELRLAELDKKIADSGRRIRLDLYGLAGLAGLAGAAKPGITPIGELDGGFSTSVKNLGGANAPFFEVGLVVEIPLNNGDRAGAARQAKLVAKKRRAVDARTQVSLDVRAAIQRLEIARRGLAIAKEAVGLSEKNVAAKNRRYKGGGTTLFEVLRAQDELSVANATFAFAQAQVEVAFANLEAARGTLLDRFGVKPDKSARNGR